MSDRVKQRYVATYKYLRKDVIRKKELAMSIVYRASKTSEQVTLMERKLRRRCR